MVFTHSSAKALCLLQSRRIILENAVESTTSVYCTDYSNVFDDFLLHRMGDTISEKNHQKHLNNQYISPPRYDSTAFSRIIHLFIAMLLFFFSLAGKAEDTLSIDVSHKQPNFIVSLKANPSTGYQWSLVRFDKQLLTLAESKYESSKTHLIGSGGTMGFTFSLNKGMSYPKSTQLVFKYARPWDKGEGAMVQNVRVHFK